MWSLSGVFFSGSDFQPSCSRSSTLRLTAVIDALRAHMLQGATLVQLAHS